MDSVDFYGLFVFIGRVLAETEGALFILLIAI